MENSDPCTKQHGQTTAASECCPHRSMLLAAMIDRHARPLKPGFWQISCDGVSVNLDDEQMARFKACGGVRYDEAEGRCVFETGYPRLDRVLGMLYEKYGLFGPDEPSDDDERGPPHRTPVS